MFYQIMTGLICASILLIKKEESSKVSSVVSVSKPDYVEKLPFKPLPPKEEEEEE
jgi:hypothetical protein